MRSYQIPLGVVIMIGGLIAGNHLSSLVLREPVGLHHLAARLQNASLEAARCYRLAALTAVATLELVTNPDRSVE